MIENVLARQMTRLRTLFSNIPPDHFLRKAHCALHSWLPKAVHETLIFRIAASLMRRLIAIMLKLLCQEICIATLFGTTSVNARTEWLLPLNSFLLHTKIAWQNPTRPDVWGFGIYFFLARQYATGRTQYVRDVWAFATLFSQRMGF